MYFSIMYFCECYFQNIGVLVHRHCCIPFEWCDDRSPCRLPSTEILYDHGDFWRFLHILNVQYSLKTIATHLKVFGTFKLKTMFLLLLIESSNLANLVCILRKRLAHWIRSEYVQLNGIWSYTTIITFFLLTLLVSWIHNNTNHRLRSCGVRGVWWFLSNWVQKSKRNLSKNLFNALLQSNFFTRKQPQRIIWNRWRLLQCCVMSSLLVNKIWDLDRSTLNRMNFLKNSPIY